MTAVNVTTDTDIVVNGCTGRDEFSFGFDELEFGTGVNLAIIPGSYGFTSTTQTFVAFDAPIEVDAGETFKLFFSVPPGLNEADILSLDFDVVVAPAIPLPAGLPLMMAGIGAFVWMRRKA